MRKLIVLYIILAAIIFAVSIILKDRIMILPYETSNCEKCMRGEYFGL